MSARRHSDKAFPQRLKDLGDRQAFPELGDVLVRWGQLLRETPTAVRLLKAGLTNKHLERLGQLVTIRGGVVPRANAFFIVRELPFDKIPARFRITKRDFTKVAVVMDGLQTPHRIEREFLRQIIKGPESLASPSTLAASGELILDVRVGKEQLRELHANGALAYLRRGETVPYRVSDDDLKSGVPSLRSNTVSRKPYWYSLHTPEHQSARIVVPEHLDSRYIATLVPAGNPSVVIDKLYTLEAREGLDVEVLLCGLNSLLTWYQIELRGRTQLGEGVLELKVPDWAGIALVDPRRLSVSERNELLTAFRPLIGRQLMNLDDELADPERATFDELYLRLCGSAQSSDDRLSLQRELRSAATERRDRTRSVTEAKVERFSRRAAASVDAFAARIASKVDSAPDPRERIPKGTPMMTLPVGSAVDGRLTVGEDLFSHGKVFAGGEIVLDAGDPEAAIFARAVLLHDPSLAAIAIPFQPTLHLVVESWETEFVSWRTKFHAAAEPVLTGVSDIRLRGQITSRALSMLHAI